MKPPFNAGLKSPGGNPLRLRGTGVGPPRASRNGSLVDDGSRDAPLAPSLARQLPDLGPQRPPQVMVAGKSVAQMRDEPLRRLDRRIGQVAGTVGPHAPHPEEVLVLPVLLPEPAALGVMRREHLLLGGQDRRDVDDVARPDA